MFDWWYLSEFVESDQIAWAKIYVLYLREAEEVRQEQQDALARLVSSMRGSCEACYEAPAKFLRGPCEGSAKLLRGLCEVRRSPRTAPARFPSARFARPHPLRLRGSCKDFACTLRGLREAPPWLLRGPMRGSCEAPAWLPARALRGFCEDRRCAYEARARFLRVTLETSARLSRLLCSC